jgi:hypothetical protein
MSSMKKTTTAVFLATLATAATTAFLLSCRPQPIYVAAPPTDLTGVYNGNHEILATLSSPQYQTMRPETFRGPIHVYETAGGHIRMTLRMYSDGDACHLEGQRNGAVVFFEPNQRCSIRFLYEGNVVISGMEMQSGNARFGGNRMELDLTGPFVAEVLFQGRRTSVSGSGRIRFWGSR